MKKILSADQIRATDQHTILHKSLASIDLMEQAAQSFTKRFVLLHPTQQIPMLLLCGTGNNGGDGLAIARLLSQEGYPKICVLVVPFASKQSPDFEINLKRLQQLDTVSTHWIESVEQFNEFLRPNKQLVIDALLGSGISKGVERETLLANCIQAVNQSRHWVVAVDVPSGMYIDKAMPQDAIAIQAQETITFEIPKRNFFFPDCEQWVGKWYVEPIGLDSLFIDSQEASCYHSTLDFSANLIQERSKFAHKGTLGHALLIAGSMDTFGACVLASEACLRSGVGLLTCHIPYQNRHTLNISVPEAMVSADIHTQHWSHVPNNLKLFQSIGVGSGIGQANETAQALLKLIRSATAPLVLDADALNIIAKHQWIDQLPQRTILTPHMKEFDRLFGTHNTWWDRVETCRTMSEKYQLVIVLKNAYTIVALPDGNVVFNNTGNPGMATAGSGDVLLGLLTGLRAQGYSAEATALLGVYWHGLAGDTAVQKIGEPSLLARDLIRFLGKSFLILKKANNNVILADQ